MKPSPFRNLQADRSIGPLRRSQYIIIFAEPSPYPYVVIYRPISMQFNNIVRRLVLINRSKFHKDRLKDHVAIIHENVRGYSVQRQETALLMYIRSTHFAWSESRHCGKGYRVLAHILHLHVRPAGCAWTARNKNGNISLAIAVTYSKPNSSYYYFFY